MEDEDFVTRIFNSANTSLSGNLSWSEFLKAMKILKSSNLREKIDLFFEIIDADGNGMLNREEVLEICKMSLTRYSSEMVAEFVDEMANHFTRYIFELLDI